MPNQLNPCASSGICTTCVDNARLDLACKVSDFGADGLGGTKDTDFVTIPGVIDVTRAPSVQTPQKTRYSGTNGLFVSGCGGRRDVTYQVTVKWFKSESLIHSLLQHGGCVAVRLVPNAPIDDTEPITHAFIGNGKLVLNGTLAFDNNSTDEMEYQFNIDLLGPDKYVGATSKDALVCT